jgi:cysteinyl-tRNA synthetase
LDGAGGTDDVSSYNTTRLGYSFILAAAFVAACGLVSWNTSQSELASNLTPAEDRIQPSLVPGDERPRLSEVRNWLYFISVDLEPDTVDAMASSEHELIVLDFVPSESNNADFPMAGVVGQLHTAPTPKLVLAYVDIGQAEDFRTYWQPGWKPGDPVWIAGTDPDGWEGNYPVGFWAEQWQAIWLGPDGYLQRIIDAGFDGVYLDWVEAYTDSSVLSLAEADGVDAQREMVEWVRRIAAFGQSQVPGFLVIVQNAAELARDDGYVAVIDGIAQEQVWFDGSADNDPPGDCPLPRTDAEIETDEYYSALSPECRRQHDEYPDSTLHVSSESYLSELQSAKEKGLVVLTVDYATDPGNVAWTYRTSRGLGFVPFVGTRALDSFVEPHK